MFEDMLKQKQIELGLTDIAFAKKIGVSRSWLCNFKNSNTKKRPMNAVTISKVYKTLNIPIDVMDEYNNRIKGL